MQDLPQLLFWFITFIVSVGMGVISFFLRQLHGDLKFAISTLGKVASELQILYERLKHAREAQMQEMLAVKSELSYIKNSLAEYKAKTETVNTDQDARLREVEKDIALLMQHK